LEKKIIVWEPWFFMAFGLFHLHRIWGLTDRKSYAEFLLWMFDVDSIYWYAVWSFFILFGGFVLALGIKLQIDKSRMNKRGK